MSNASRKILLAYQPEAVQLVKEKRIRKDLAVQAEGGVLYCADRGFRSRIGVPIVDGKSELGMAILRDFHMNGGHVQGGQHACARVEREYYVTGIRKLVTEIRKACMTCRRLKPEELRAFTGRCRTR